MRTIGIILFIIFSPWAWSAPSKPSSSVPLGFAAWKLTQVEETRNKVIQVTNQIRLLKLKKSKLKVPEKEKSPTKTTEEGRKSEPQNHSEIADNSSGPHSQVKVEKETQKGKLDSQIIDQEKKLSVLLTSLQYAKELSIEEYVVVYLKAYKDNPEAINKVAKELNPDQVKELLVMVLDSDLKD